MAKGVDVDIAVGDGGGPEAFTVIGGGTSAGLSIAGQIVDNTTKDDNLKRSLLAGGGISSMSMPLSGVIKAGNAEAQQLVRDTDAGTIRNYQFSVPGFMSFTGPFQPSNFEITAENGATVSFTATFESAGQIDTVDLP